MSLDLTLLETSLRKPWLRVSQRGRGALPAMSWSIEQKLAYLHAH